VTSIVIALFLIKEYYGYYVALPTAAAVKTSTLYDIHTFLLLDYIKLLDLHMPPTPRPYYA